MEPYQDKENQESKQIEETKQSIESNIDANSKESIDWNSVLKLPTPEYIKEHYPKINYLSYAKYLSKLDEKVGKDYDFNSPYIEGKYNDPKLEVKEFFKPVGKTWKAVPVYYYKGQFNPETQEEEGRGIRIWSTGRITQGIFKGRIDLAPRREIDGNFTIFNISGNNNANIDNCYYEIYFEKSGFWKGYLKDCRKEGDGIGFEFGRLKVGRWENNLFVG